MFTSIKTACPIFFFFLLPKSGIFWKDDIYVLRIIHMRKYRNNTWNFVLKILVKCQACTEEKKKVQLCLENIQNKLSITDSLNSTSHLHTHTQFCICWFILLLFGNLKSRLPCLQVTIVIAVLKNGLQDVVEFRHWKQNCSIWLSRRASFVVLNYFGHWLLLRKEKERNKGLHTLSRSD